MPFDSTKNFWTAPGAVDPKRNFRFRVSLFGQSIWWARDVDQPQATVSEATHDFMTHRFYYPSKVTWNEINMTLVDPVTPGTLDQLLLTLRQTGYIIPSLTDGDQAFSSISKPEAVAALASSTGRTTTTGDAASVEIEVVNSDGNALHTWTLNNAFIKSVTPSQLSYTSEELMTVTLGIRYDWADYVSNAGTVIGGQPENNEVPNQILRNGLFNVQRS